MGRGRWQHHAQPTPHGALHLQGAFFLCPHERAAVLLRSANFFAAA
jgi:hypothetical protein